MTSIASRLNSVTKLFGDTISDRILNTSVGGLIIGGLYNLIASTPPTSLSEVFVKYVLPVAGAAGVATVIETDQHAYRTENFNEFKSQLSVRTAMWAAAGAVVAAATSYGVGAARETLHEADLQIQAQCAKNPNGIASLKHSDGKEYMTFKCARMGPQ